MAGSAILTTFHLDGPTENGLYHNIYYNRVWLEQVHALTKRELPHFIVLSESSFVPPIFYELRYPVVIVQEGSNQLEHFHIGAEWLDSLGFDYVYMIEQDLSISRRMFHKEWHTDLFFGNCTVNAVAGFEKSFFCGPVATIKASLPESIVNGLEVDLKAAFDGLASPFEENHWTYDFDDFEPETADGSLPTLKHHYPAEYLFGYEGQSWETTDPNRILLRYLNARLGPQPGPPPP